MSPVDESADKHDDTNARDDHNDDEHIGWRYFLRSAALGAVGQPPQRPRRHSTTLDPEKSRLRSLDDGKNAFRDLLGYALAK